MDYDFIERMLKELPSLIFYKNDKAQYEFCTHYWHHLKEYDQPGWSIKGKTDLEIRKDKENAQRAYEQDMHILKTGEGCTNIVETNIDGKVDYLEIIKRPVKDESGKVIGIVGLINDVTQRILMEKELEVYARTDTLTGFYNRNYLHYWTMNELNDQSCPLALISCDCDNLKHINDTYGHNIGDEYLRLSTSVFRIVMPERAKLFRHGGDEFLLAVPNCDEKQAQEYIEKIQSTADALKIKGEKVGISIGYTIMKSSSESFPEAMRDADVAMYKDKQSHKLFK